MAAIPTHFIAKQAAADTNPEIFFQAEILLKLILCVMTIFQSNFFGTKWKKILFKSLKIGNNKLQAPNYKKIPNSKSQIRLNANCLEF
jgi:hypothetical protein